jgi:ADP-ribose pyrophosphatase YjhB (NUDIX family)
VSRDLPLLDEVRIIARNGLRYADDRHDERRYERLLELVAERYAPDGNVTSADAEPAENPSADDLYDRFVAEPGHVTPKVGAQAVVTDDDGRVLLIERADTGHWSLPGGFVDAHESPRETAVRETREETGLAVVTDRVACVVRHDPFEHRPHAVIGVTYHCRRTGGAIDPGPEASAAAFRDPDAVSNWYPDMETSVRRALDGVDDDRGESL